MRRWTRLFLILGLLAVLGALPMTGAAAQVRRSVWSAPLPTAQPPPNPQLFSVSCVPTGTSPSNWCVAVGGRHNYTATGTAQTYLDLTYQWTGGPGWVTTASPLVPGGNLLGVSCVSTTFCMAVGGVYHNSAPSTLNIKEWNGAGWIIQNGVPSANVTSIQKAVLFSVSCLSIKMCVAVGAYIKQPATGLPGKVPLVPLTMVWNGVSWTAHGVPAVPTSQRPSGNIGGALWSVSCGVESKCLAAGGVYKAGTAKALQPLTYYWTGSAWKYVKDPTAALWNGAHKNGVLYGASCGTQIKVCMVVGTVHKKASAGRWVVGNPNWTGLPAASPAPFDVLYSVYCVNTGSKCIAVGAQGAAAGWGQWGNPPFIDESLGGCLPSAASPRLLSDAGTSSPPGLNVPQSPAGGPGPDNVFYGIDATGGPMGVGSSSLTTIASCQASAGTGDQVLEEN